MQSLLIIRCIWIYLSIKNPERYLSSKTTEPCANYIALYLFSLYSRLVCCASEISLKRTALEKTEELRTSTKTTFSEVESEIQMRLC